LSHRTGSGADGGGDQRSFDPITRESRVLPRQRIVLAALRDRGFLSEEDLARAQAEEVSPRKPSRAMLAPHLIDSLHKEGRLAAHGTTKTTIDTPTIVSAPNASRRMT